MGKTVTTDYDVAIIGAGAAGIAAARRLAGSGRSVALLEASHRVGGRAFTAGFRGMPLDMGCGWLHSAERNPLVKLGREAGFTIEQGPSAWQEQWRDLGFSAEEQQTAGSTWGAFERRLHEAPPQSDRAADALTAGDEWNEYCQALSGYMNGAALERLSVRDFLAYDDAASENNWRLHEGYGSLIGGLLPPLTSLHLSTPVRRIGLSGDGVRLESPRGTITAAAAIVTASTNVLARGDILFDREADDHIEAAARLPLGLADKLFLELHGNHGLEAETHVLGNPRNAATGSYYIRPLGRPVIEGFFGGKGAVMLEDMGVLDAFAFALEELSALLGSDIRRHLRPLVSSAWCHTDWIHGSYSHALPGHSVARQILARPLGERLFFAGEATHSFDFSTAHGAWETGMRAADEVLSALKG